MYVCMSVGNSAHLRLALVSWSTCFDTSEMNVKTPTTLVVNVKLLINVCMYVYIYAI